MYTCTAIDSSTQHVEQDVDATVRKVLKLQLMSTCHQGVIDKARKAILNVLRSCKHQGVDAAAKREENHP